MSCRVMSNYVLSCNVMSCSAVQCHVLPCVRLYFFVFSSLCDVVVMVEVRAIVMVCDAR